MELTRILKILSRRRRLVAVGAAVALIAALLSVYQVGLFPPSLKSRTNVFATASTQILIDTPDSTFADIANDIEPLEARAGVFARFLASPEAIALIGRHANLPADAIEAQGPYEMNLPLFQQEPTAERRSSQIIGEGALYRLRFENNPELPVISVFAQAPTKDEAVALASAAPAALRGYVERIQAKQHTPVEHQVEIRKLGHAVGGVVNAHANAQIAGLVFTVVMVGWCMLLIPGQTIARGWREPAGDDDRHSAGSVAKGGNGHGRGEEVLRLGPEHERAP
jgi:hypothetical protein